MYIAEIFAQESIHQSQSWFMACVSYAPGMARKMAEHIRGCPDYARQLHTIYLANDILLKSCAASPYIPIHNVRICGLWMGAPTRDLQGESCAPSHSLSSVQEQGNSY